VIVSVVPKRHKLARKVTIDYETMHIMQNNRTHRQPIAMQIVDLRVAADSKRRPCPTPVIVSFETKP
jgi:hypothetical protein